MNSLTERLWKTLRVVDSKLVEKWIHGRGSYMEWSLLMHGWKTNGQNTVCFMFGISRRFAS